MISTLWSERVTSTCPEEEGRQRRREEGENDYGNREKVRDSAIGEKKQDHLSMGGVEEYTLSWAV